MSDFLLKEKRTLEAMTFIYCRGNGHKALHDELCDACKDILNYAFDRLNRCGFGAAKPICAECPVHCYQPEQRKKITSIMRYSGPKMLLRHPFLAMHHILHGMKKPDERVQKYRKRRQDRKEARI